MRSTLQVLSSHLDALQAGQAEPAATGQSLYCTVPPAALHRLHSRALHSILCALYSICTLHRGYAGTDLHICCAKAHGTLTDTLCPCCPQLHTFMWRHPSFITPAGKQCCHLVPPCKNNFFVAGNPGSDQEADDCTEDDQAPKQPMLALPAPPAQSTQETAAQTTAVSTPCLSPEASTSQVGIPLQAYAHSIAF